MAQLGIWGNLTYCQQFFAESTNLVCAIHKVNLEHFMRLSVCGVHIVTFFTFLKCNRIKL